MLLVSSAADLEITKIETSRKTLEPEGDFFRYVLANSSNCILVERINHRLKGAKLKDSRRICKLQHRGSTYSLEGDSIQDFNVESIGWNDLKLELKATLVAKEKGAPAQEIRCQLDTTDPKSLLLCKPWDEEKPKEECLASGDSLNWITKYCSYIIESDDEIAIQASDCYREDAFHQ
jgi:hypothetical protein